MPNRFEFEFDARVQPTVSYVICSLPRSGRSLLCELLAEDLSEQWVERYLAESG